MAFFTASKINNMKTAYRNGDLEKALSYADRLRPSDVHTAYDLTMMADIYMESERYIAAKRVYVELYKKNESTRLCKQIIDLNIRTDCLEQAIQYVKELKKLDEDDYERDIYQFRIGKAMGQPDEYLIQNLLKVREADYIDVWAFELAKLFFKTGRISECETECQNIILWFPETDYARKARLLIEACHSGTGYDEIIETIHEKHAEEEENESYTEIDISEYAGARQADNLAFTEVPLVSGADSAEEDAGDDIKADERELEEAACETEANDEDGDETEADDEAADETEADDEDGDETEANDESGDETGVKEENKVEAGETEAKKEDGEKAPEDEPDYEEMPIYDPFEGEELPEIDFLEGAGISTVPETAETVEKAAPEEKEEIPVADEPAEEKIKKTEKHVPSQNTIIRDAIADEVLKALQAQEAGEAEGDDVDATVLKMIQEDDKRNGQ